MIFKKYLLLAILVFLIMSCSKTYIIPQKQLTNSPCLTKENGVNVRIKNSGDMVLSEITLNKVDYCGLKPGELTCYKNMPFVWTNNSLAVQFYSSKRKGYSIELNAIDYMGENKIESGYVTIEIIARPSSDNKSTVESKLIVDK